MNQEETTTYNAILKEIRKHTEDYHATKLADLTKRLNEFVNAIEIAKRLDAVVIRQGVSVAGIIMILEDVKSTYNNDKFIEERLTSAIKRVKELQPINMIKDALMDFNDAMIDILPEDFDGKKVNAIYDKILNALSV